MPMPPDAPVLAASFTLGCMLIHACRRQAPALTGLLSLVLAIVSLVLLALVIDRASGDIPWHAKAGETSERIYGFE